MGLRRKARECALQMLFAADVAGGERADELVRAYWQELGDPEMDEAAREFATRLATGALAHTAELDERIRSRAEHWRIPRMAVVDRNVLRLAVYEFLFEPTPRTVAINEALEIARRFSTYEATQFINGILDAIKRDLDRERPQETTDDSDEPAAPASDASTEASAAGDDGHAGPDSHTTDAPVAPGGEGEPDPTPSSETDDEQKASA